MIKKKIKFSNVFSSENNSNHEIKSHFISNNPSITSTKKYFAKTPHILGKKYDFFKNQQKNSFFSEKKTNNFSIGSTQTQPLTINPL